MALLVMRVVIALALASTAISGVSDRPSIRSSTISVLQVAAGFFLLVGLWTPLAGLLVVGLEGWLLFSEPPDPWIQILLATLAGALALLGPGAWSVDARLFGWKRIDIRDRRAHSDASAAP